MIAVTTVYVDKLSLLALAQIVLARVGIAVLTRRGSVTIYYFVSSRWITKWVAIWGAILPIQCKELDYTLANIRDADGSSPNLRVQVNDPLEISDRFGQLMLESNPLIKMLSRRFDKDRLLIFLKHFIAQEAASALLSNKMFQRYYRQKPKRPS